MRLSNWRWAAVAVLLASMVGCLPSAEDQRRIEQWEQEKEGIERRMSSYEQDLDRVQKNAYQQAESKAISAEDAAELVMAFRNGHAKDQLRVDDLNYILGKIKAPIPMYAQVALGVCLLAAIGAMLDARKCRNKLAELQGGRSAGSEKSPGQE